jgi:class 3 adenylate cyclase
MQEVSFQVQERVVLFTDLHDYSIVVTTLGKHQTLSFLQEMYEKFGDLVVACQGEIIKYMGDAMLCVFPAGSEIEVIQCALQLRKTYFEMIDARNITHETELEVGISAGEVEIGIIGHKSFLQKDIFGEAVNRAGVIGHHRGIAMTENIYHTIKTAYKTAQLPDVTVKWQTEPLKIWEIVE